MTPRPLASLRGVEKRYRRGTLAVQGVDLDIMPGTFVALLGASGCGKSTLLRLIAGLETPSAGRIEWPTAAHDAAGPAGARRVIRVPGAEAHALGHRGGQRHAAAAAHGDAPGRIRRAGAGDGGMRAGVA